MKTIKKVENGFEKIILSNNDESNFAEIIPSCGAILNAFVIKGFNYIDGFQSRVDFDKNVTTNFKSNKLSPFVCRMHKGQFSFEGASYQVDKFLLKGHAIHGLLFDKPFDKRAEHADESAAEVELIHHYIGEDEGFPFPYDCIVKYSLRKDSALQLNTEMINTGTSSMPAMDGWHPYFQMGKKIDGLEMFIPSDQMVEFNDELLPTGNLVEYAKGNNWQLMKDVELDNSFLLDFSGSIPECVLRNAERNVQLTIRPDASYPYLQVYTPPHRNSIAIENLSGAPDAFNNKMGLLVLQAGESKKFSTLYRVEEI